MVTSFVKAFVAAAVVVAPLSAGAAMAAKRDDNKRINSVQFDPTKGDAWSEEQMREAMPMTQTLPGKMLIRPEGTR